MEGAPSGGTWTVRGFENRGTRNYRTSRGPPVGTRRSSSWNVYGVLLVSSASGAGGLLAALKVFIDPPHGAIGARII